MKPASITAHALAICDLFTIPLEDRASRFSTGFTTMRSCLASMIALVSLVAAGSMPTQAADDASISVNVNMARVLRINAPAATVIVGNPGVADVTIQDPQTLILTGKSYGQTNLIVLNSRGEPVADTMIQVVQMQAGVVTVYQGLNRTSLSCAPTCQPTVMLGDQTDFTSGVVASSQLVQGVAN